MSFLQLVLLLDKTIEGINSILPKLSLLTGSLYHWMVIHSYHPRPKTI